MGRGNNDDLINSLKAMMNNTEDVSAGSASKKVKDDGDDFDREISSQLSDTLSRAMKNIKTDTAVREDGEGGQDGRTETSEYLQGAILIDGETDAATDGTPPFEVDKTLDEEDFDGEVFDEVETVEVTEEELAPIVIEEIDERVEAARTEDAGRTATRSLLDIFDVESALLDDDEDNELFLDGDALVDTAEAKREKSQRSARLIESLMSEISLREGDAEDSSVSVSQEDEDAEFIASLKQISRASSVSARDKSDNVQRRGFVTNDADIENSVYLPNAEPVEKSHTKKEKAKDKIKEKKKSRRENERRLRDKDVSLAISLGYEYELAERIGYDEVKERKRRSLEERMLADGDGSPYEADAEYTDVSQGEKIKSEYQRISKSFKVKTILTAVIFLLLLAVENLGLFAEKGLGGELGVRPAAVYLVSFLLTVGASLMSMRELASGFTDALKFNASAFSASSITVFSVLAYDVVALVILMLGGKGYMLVNAPVVLGLLVTLVSRCLDCKREYTSFCIVSSPTAKYLAEEYEPIVKNRERRYYSKNRQKDCEGFLRACEVGSVDGYFEQTSRSSLWYKNQNFVVAPIIAAVLVIFMVSYIKSEELMSSFAYMMAALAVCMPVPMCLFNSVCLFRASRDMKKKNCTMIGESAADRYSEAGGVIFKESSMISARLTGIDRERTCSDEELSRISPYLSRIARLLDSSVTEALIETFGDGDGEEASVRVELVEDDGIVATTDSGNTVYIGEREFMIRHRLSVQSANISLNNEEIYKRNVGVLYVAVDDLMCWKIFLEYSVREELAGIVSILAEEGIEVGIETSNPNINDDFLLKHHIPTSVNFFDSDRFAINCASDGDGEGDSPRSEGEGSGYSGIVALKETDIVYPIVWCKRICENLRFGVWVVAISVTIAALIMGCVALMGAQELMSSAALTLISAVMSLPSAFAGAFCRPVRTLPQAEDTEAETGDKNKQK